MIRTNAIAMKRKSPNLIGGIAAVVGVVGVVLIASNSVLLLAPHGPETGLLGLALLPVILVFLYRRLRYDFLAPASLFAFAWTLAVAVAQFPFFPRHSWSARMWLLVIVPPTTLVVSAAIATGRSARNRVPFRFSVKPSVRAAWLYVGFLIVGSVIIVASFLSIGSIPLLSANVDAARFEKSIHPFWLLMTRLVPMAVLLSIVAAVFRSPLRWLFCALALVGTLLLAAQGGRLHFAVPIVSAGLFLYMVRGLHLRSGIVMVLSCILMLSATSWIFLWRASQHPDLPFERHFFSVLESRHEALDALTPLQIGLSSSLYTLSELVATGALQNESGRGFFSLHGLDRYLPAKDSEEVSRRVVGPLWTSTYLADLYGDFGWIGATIWSAACGISYGRLYRRAILTHSPILLILYCYAAFWLIFFIYLNVWTYQIFWFADLIALGFGARVLFNRKVSHTRGHVLSTRTARPSAIGVGLAN